MLCYKRRKVRRLLVILTVGKKLRVHFLIFAYALGSQELPVLFVCKKKKRESDRQTASARQQQLSSSSRAI
jgi:hypothetical protein